MVKLLLEKKGQKWINQYYDNGECCVMRLINSETKEIYELLIDNEDFEKVSKGQWFMNKHREDSHRKTVYTPTWSEKTNGKQYNYALYQYILGTKLKNQIVDHINMDRFDNRKANLRIVSSRINSLNNKHKGYNYDKNTGKWLVRIKVLDKEMNIGRYATEEEAEIIRLKAMILLDEAKYNTNALQRIEELNIKLTEEDLKTNKYLIKIKNKLEGKDNSHLNGRYNRLYDKYIDVIKEKVNEGLSWNAIAKFLKENNLITNARSEIVKKNYIRLTK